jgi:hypothetical protein
MEISEVDEDFKPWEKSSSNKPKIHLEDFEPNKLKKRVRKTKSEEKEETPDLEVIFDKLNYIIRLLEKMNQK